MGWVKSVIHTSGMLALVSTAILASPALAQQADEAAIDRLIDATTTNEGTLALARELVGNDDLTGAAATLERALLGRQGAASDAVRLYYASVLCRLDDRRRAMYQLGNVVAADAQGWAEARQACGDVAVPVATRGNDFVGEVSVGLTTGRGPQSSLTVATRANAPFGTTGTHSAYLQPAERFHASAGRVDFHLRIDPPAPGTLIGG